VFKKTSGAEIELL